MTVIRYEHPEHGSHALGKAPASEDRRDLKFAAYADAAKLPQPPSGSFGHSKIVIDYGMLGNDNYGDCVFAGAAHETMLWNAEAGHAVQFTDTAVLSDYSAVTGFDPNDPSSDQGTDVRQALKYRQKTGIVDASGKRHKIGAYVALTPGNPTELWQALYLFGAVGIGIQFPETAMDQFNAGTPWSIVKGARIDGGHYVPIVARQGKTTPECVTWARRQAMTRGFYEAYCDEAFALLSVEMLKGGRSLEGFDLAQLRADLPRL